MNKHFTNVKKAIGEKECDARSDCSGYVFTKDRFKACDTGELWLWNEENNVNKGKSNEFGAGYDYYEKCTKAKDDEEDGDEDEGQYNDKCKAYPRVYKGKYPPQKYISKEWHGVTRKQAEAECGKMKECSGFVFTKNKAKRDTDKGSAYLWQHDSKDYEGGFSNGWDYYEKCELDGE